MTSQREVPEVPVATNGTVNGAVNGVNGDRRPETPTGSMALTEYSINPSTPSEEKRARIKQVVPEEFLLPTGYPDVSTIIWHQWRKGSGLLIQSPHTVPPTHCQRNIPSLRGLQGHRPHPRHQPQQPTRVQGPPQARG